MPSIDRSTHRLHYEVRGRQDGPPLLLIMGLGLSSSSWHTLPSRLEARFSVITFDNAGTGRSSPPPSFRMSHMADDAAAILDAAGIERASVFGMSMGGMIAIELALRHPRRLHRLALGATHGGYLRSRKPALGTLALLMQAAVVGKGVSEARLARILVSEDAYARDPARFGSWLAAMEPAPTRVVLGQMSAIMRHAADDRLARIAAPTLILTGDRDRLVPAANSRRLAERIEGARLVELANSGHCFPVERQDEVAGLLERFFLEG